jgi:metal-responsive CopG/Arc/MetJ family transcriptional regulator
MTEVITISINSELKAKLDELRGDTTRSKFISRLVENALDIRKKK